MNKAETAKVMTYIFADHDIAIPENKLMVWHDQLKAVPYEKAMKAARVLVSRKSYGLPKVSDFLECINASKESVIDESQVYAIAMEAVRRYGYYNEEMAMKALRNTDPRLEETIKRYGWKALCEEETSKASVTRAQLWKTFSAVQKQSEVQQVLTAPPSQKILDMPEVKKLL